MSEGFGAFREWMRKAKPEDLESAHEQAAHRGEGEDHVEQNNDKRATKVHGWLIEAGYGGYTVEPAGTRTQHETWLVRDRSGTVIKKIEANEPLAPISEAEFIGKLREKGE